MGAGSWYSKDRVLYLKMASVWHQMAQRWEKNG
jgi:hypothetical protein